MECPFEYGLSWAESTQSLVLILISLRFILILPSHPRLGLPKDLIPAGVPVKMLKALLYLSIQATWPVYLNLLDLIALTILSERYKLWSPLHSPFASLLGPNIRLRILFSNTLSLRSSLNVRDHASQPSQLAILFFFIYFNFQILREKSRRQECLDWIITWISCFKSTFYFFLNIIKICH